MPNTAFVQGLLKAAASVEKENEKRAYGERLTKLLQRKGKLPADSKPTIGVSSFPTLKQAFEGVLPAAGAVMGYSKESPVFGPLVGALAGYGADQALGSKTVSSALNSGIDVVPGLRAFGTEHPVLGNLGIAAGAGALGYGAYSGLKKLQDLLKRPSSDKPATEEAAAVKTANAELGQLLGASALPLAGAGAGGLLGAATGQDEDRATGQKGTRLRNALLGALAGGGAGLALPHVLNQFSSPAEGRPSRDSVTTGLPSFNPDGPLAVPSYESPTAQNNSLRVLQDYGFAPPNLSRNAPPSSLTR